VLGGQARRDAGDDELEAAVMRIEELERQRARMRLPMARKVSLWIRDFMFTGVDGEGESSRSGLLSALA
jgi:hypothetical protein